MTPAPQRIGMQRLVTAATASMVLVALAWAAMHVRAQQHEVQMLTAELTAARRTERAAGAAGRAVPLGEIAAHLAEMKRRLAEAEEQQKHAAGEFAARERELREIVDFLREENTAAQQAIERLSKPEIPPVPVSPSKPDARKPPVRKVGG